MKGFDTKDHEHAIQQYGYLFRSISKHPQHIATYLQNIVQKYENAEGLRRQLTDR